MGLLIIVYNTVHFSFKKALLPPFEEGIHLALGKGTFK
jgi:hypothetical protein